MKYHPGELQAQRSAGVSAQALRLSGMISPEISYGAQHFLENVQTLALTLLDKTGWPQTIWLNGFPGMVQVLGSSQILLNRQKIILAWDQLERSLSDGAEEIGLIVMDFETRRRFRVNGTALYKEEGILIEVEQAYGNCPKYIQKRFFEEAHPEKEDLLEVHTGMELEASQIKRIQESDTFFVGSRNSSGKVDTSHRGGNPGFIEVISPKLIRIPDYAGNNMFNTLGNFVSDPRASILFPDFQSGSELRLKGRVSIDWEGQTLDQPVQRYWTFAITGWKETRRSFPMEAYHLEYSPFNPSSKSYTNDHT